MNFLFWRIKEAFGKATNRFTIEVSVTSRRPTTINWFGMPPAPVKTRTIQICPFGHLSSQGRWKVVPQIMNEHVNIFTHIHFFPLVNFTPALIRCKCAPEKTLHKPTPCTLHQRAEHNYHPMSDPAQWDTQVWWVRWHCSRESPLPQQLHTSNSSLSNC